MRLSEIKSGQVCYKLNSSMLQVSFKYEVALCCFRLSAVEEASVG